MTASALIAWMFITSWWCDPTFTIRPPAGYPPIVLVIRESPAPARPVERPFRIEHWVVK